jgi:transcriptional regulator with XRE-family HTH domain
MLHAYFKQTMDRFGVRNLDLAEAFGCSRNHISEIRNGKCNPPINRFWELVETMDKLAPGSKQYFASLIAGYDRSFTRAPQEMIESMDNNQLSAMLFLIAEALRKNRENTDVKIDAQLLTVS